MFLNFGTFSKTLAIAAVCGLLAACQTSGLKPGSLTTDFAPKGWLSETRGNKSVYVCPPSICKSPQVVVVGPVKVRGNVEQAIREDIISRELMNAIDNLVNVASKGQARFSTDRRVVTKTYTGFDMSAFWRSRDGNIYGNARVIVQNDRGSIVASFAKSRSAARANLQRFLRRTTIRRVP
jgi:hypothetical protein